jgi:hypothetical protein
MANDQQVTVLEFLTETPSPHLIEIAPESGRRPDTVWPFESALSPLFPLSPAAVEKPANALNLSSRLIAPQS